jgi:hypothetical protein
MSVESLVFLAFWQIEGFFKMAVSGAFSFIHEARTYLSSLVHGQRDTESFDGKSWPRVNSKVNWVENNNKLWVSLGANCAREEIYFDESSKKIQALKAKVCNQSRRKKVFQALTKVNDLVNGLTKVKGEHDATTEIKLDERMEELLKIHRSRQGTKICLPMDYLIYKGILVCRHKALIAASLLRELVEQKILPFGKVRQFRSTIQKDNKIASSHAWAVYRDCTTGHLWICDPRLNVALNVNTDFSQLVDIYTKAVLVSMIERLDDQDVYQPLIDKLNKYKTPFTIQTLKCDSNVSYPGIQICISFNHDFLDHQAFCHALSLQGVRFSKLNKTLTLSLINNPAIFTLEVDKLMKDSGIVIKSIPEIQSSMPVSNTLLFSTAKPCEKFTQSGNVFNFECEIKHRSKTILAF